METTYDTEIEEAEKVVAPDNAQSSASDDKGESAFKESVDSLTDSVYVEDTESTEEIKILTENSPMQAVEETVFASASNEPKTFDQSGYEVAVVFCLAVIIGLMIWDSLSKRWHT